MSDGGVHGRYPARAAVAGSTLDGGQCGGRCRAPIHLASGEPRSVVAFCRVAKSKIGPIVSKYGLKFRFIDGMEIHAVIEQ